MDQEEYGIGVKSRRGRANNISMKCETFSLKRAYMFRLTFESFSEITQTNINKL